MNDIESDTGSKNTDKLVIAIDEIEVNNKMRNIIFTCLALIATLSSCDGGIVPQQNSNIQEDFGGDGEQRVGLFGSIDYIGRVVGALIFTFIMGKMNRKYLIISTLLFKSVTLFVPLITVNYIINDIARCLSGLSQVFYPTYFPVWCDQYGKANLKTIWVTIVQVGNPLGIITGYGLAMLCDKIKIFGLNGWRSGFALEGIILIIFAIIILFFNKIYFSEKFVLINDSKGKEEEKKEENQKFTLFENIGKILCNKIFLFSSLGNSVAFFGIGVVQYFGDKYMKLVLKIGDSLRFILFGVLCLLGPTSGMVVGGIVCSKLGGYVKRVSMIYVIIAMLIAAAISMAIACHEIIVLFVIASWTYLFAIGNVVPPISGIIISCLDNSLRGDGFSFCNFLNNLFGNFPSSYVFSLLVDLFDDKTRPDSTSKYKSAWMITMGYNFVGLFFIILGGVFRFRIKGDLSETTEKTEIIEKKISSEAIIGEKDRKTEDNEKNN